MNLKFYFISTLSLTVCSLLAFFVGVEVANNFLVSNLGKPYGEAILAYTIYAMVFSILSFIIGVFIGFLVIHRLGRKWGPQLNFGSHPVLKLTFLSFLTFLGLLVLLLFLIPSTP